MSGGPNDSRSPRIEEVFTELVRKEGAEDGIVVAWITVCEVLDPASGQLSLWTVTDQQTPYWKGTGMLHHAQDALLPEDADD